MERRLVRGEAVRQRIPAPLLRYPVPRVLGGEHLVRVRVRVSVRVRVRVRVRVGG